MIDSFLSVVVEIGARHNLKTVTDFLEKFSDTLADKLADYEVILVNNGALLDLADLELDESIRRNCYILKLARPVSWDDAVFAGLEQANGDFAVCYDIELADHFDTMEAMIQRAIKGADLVNLRDTKALRSGLSVRRRLFFAALKLSGEKHLHPLDRQEFLLSRRALNWVVRDQTSNVYLNDAISSLGFETDRLDVELPHVDARRTYSEAAGQAWSTLAQSARFLSGLAQFVIMCFFAIFALTSADALMVRFLGRNLFWQPDTIVPGWTFLVLIISVGFMMFSVLLYIILKMNLLILRDMRQQPRYIIEQFGRI